ncbi:hypothetical protein NMG60_11004450 [Bertholletia excelsa]
MNFLTGSRNSWQPVMTGDTTAQSYWLNWRVFLCSIWVLITIAVASFLISKYEGPRNSEPESKEETQEETARKSKPESREETREETAGILYEDQVWKPCLRGIHPAWLLGFRVIAFFVLLALLILNAAVDGGEIFYFYTQWTFTLITIYFGLGSLLSMYGCYKYHNKVSGIGADNENFDAEQGNYGASSSSNGTKHLGNNQDCRVRQIAGFWGYVFQIIFQMNAGAVMLTDCVFWFIIVPFLTIKDYELNFLIINMHTINAVFLIGDTALNCLSFPWFRIAYFFLWTAVFVIFQWIVHACVSLWWPYPFLDLSSPFSPLWYSSVALMHVPCFGIFVLVMKMKHSLLSNWFPHSYQSVK